MVVDVAALGSGAHEAPQHVVRNRMKNPQLVPLPWFRCQFSRLIQFEEAIGVL